MNSDSLEYVLREFAGRPLTGSKPRDLSLRSNSGKVIGLSGVRRCGKTFLFFDTIRRLAARGVDRRRIVDLNFEDDRLQPVETSERDLVLRSLRETFSETTTGRLYLFLDEVQSAPGPSAGSAGHGLLVPASHPRPLVGVARPEHHLRDLPSLVPGAARLPGDRARA